MEFQQFELKLRIMSFNIFIWMELNFHKIHSLFSSIDHLIVTNNVKQHGTQMFGYLVWIFFFLVESCQKVTLIPFFG
jgi:hypothetical protein